jgi:hypothetical protein
MAAYAGPTSVSFQPDEDVMTAHLENWFGECMEGEIDIGWSDPITGGIKSFKRFDVGDFDEAATFAARVNAIPGQSVYFRPAVIRLGSKRYVTDDDAQYVPGVWCDMDDEGAVEKARTIYSTCQPTSVVVTGRKPYIRAHLYWKFSEPVTAGSGASETFVGNEYPKYSTVTPFPQETLHPDLPVGLDPFGIIALHYWRDDE